MRDDWIITYSGIRFWPLDPDPELIRIEDIAHHLSNICRWTGACEYHFSVAQHSVLVSQEVHEGHELWGLLHDAGEAYGLPDMAAPVKPEFPELIKREKAILMAAIYKYGLPWPMPNEVKRADTAVAITEWGALMNGSLADTRYAKSKPAVHAHVTRMVPEQAERWFLARFRELYD